MVGKQAIRHADVAADALWTDELNPVTRGAGANLTAGAVPANRAIDVSAAGVGVDRGGGGGRRRQAGGCDDHAGARRAPADRPGAGHSDHVDRQRSQPGAAEGVVYPNRGGAVGSAPLLQDRSTKHEMKLCLIIAYLPVVSADRHRRGGKRSPLPGHPGNRWRLEHRRSRGKSAWTRALPEEARSADQRLGRRVVGRRWSPGSSICTTRLGLSQETRSAQKPMTNLQVVTWPVEKLIPYARNARTHY